MCKVYTMSVTVFTSLMNVRVLYLRRLAVILIHICCCFPTIEQCFKADHDYLFLNACAAFVDKST